MRCRRFRCSLMGVPMKLREKAILTASILLAASAASAQTAPASGGLDLSSLTDQVETDQIIAAILSVGAAGVLLRLAWVAVKYVRGLTKSA